MLDNSGRGVGASQIVRVRTIHYINTINKYKATKAIMKTLAAFFFCDERLTQFIKLVTFNNQNRLLALCPIVVYVNRAIMIGVFTPIQIYFINVYCKHLCVSHRFNVVIH